MNFVLLITEAPYTHQAADSAWEFARAALNKGHQISQIFFYADGVYLASSLLSPEQSERNITKKWVDLAARYDLSMLVCSNTAMKRGVLSPQVAQQLGSPNFNLDKAFTMAGLGQFADAVSCADRLLCFGA